MILRNIRARKELIIYQNTEGTIKIDVRLEDETVWLTQALLAELFGKDKRTISEHIGNVFSFPKMFLIVLRHQ